MTDVATAEEKAEMRSQMYKHEDIVEWLTEEGLINEDSSQAEVVAAFAARRNAYRRTERYAALVAGHAGVAEQERSERQAVKAAEKAAKAAERQAAKDEKEKASAIAAEAKKAAAAKAAAPAPEAPAKATKASSKKGKGATPAAGDVDPFA